MGADWTLQFLNPLSLIGACYLILTIQNVLRYIYTYTRSSALLRYREADAWALVTGATEGIGLALSTELARQGFNVVVHGRNPQKLVTVRKNLSKDFPALKFRVAVADAMVLGSEARIQIEKIARDLRGVKQKVLINNVGGAPIFTVPRFKSFDQTTSQDNDDMLALNVGFPVQLTAALMPALVENQPSLIITLGSMADYGSPCSSILWSSRNGSMKRPGEASETHGLEQQVTPFDLILAPRLSLISVSLIRQLSYWSFLHFRISRPLQTSRSMNLLSSIPFQCTLQVTKSQNHSSRTSKFISNISFDTSSRRLLHKLSGTRPELLMSALC